MIWVTATIMVTCAASFLALIPRPRLPKEPEPLPRIVPLDPEPEYDPSAFWLFPDWDSGPIDEPFWMRPLKVPAPRVETYNGPAVVFGGTAFVPGNLIYYGYR